MTHDVEFSPCGNYRYRFGMGEKGKTLAFLMLNPSIANAEILDPTLTRCWKRAQMLGYTRMEIVNLFALVSTDPKGLYTCEDPVGPDNDRAILEVANNADMLVCAWSNHARFNGREAAVLEMLKGVPKYALKINKDGTPRHPLYVPYSIQPQLWS